MMNKLYIYFYLLALVFTNIPPCAKAAESACQTINLAGEWRCKLDVTRDFRIRKMFRHKLEFPYTAHLPGSLDENRLGIRTVGKNPWHLNREYEYVGPVIYQRDVDIPESWKGKEITLYLERCHWETKLYVDDIYFDMRESLSTPHVYDLSDLLTPGKHSLSIRVDNTMKYDIGVNAHAITEHTQTNWNGIIGRIELQARDKVHVNDVQLYPDVEDKSVRIRLTMINDQGRQVIGTLVFKAESWNTTSEQSCRTQSQRITLDGKETHVEIVYPLGENAQLWDEFNPVLYHMHISFSGKSGKQKYWDDRTVNFALRKFKTQGRQFVVNGRPTFLRGTLECCIFPLTGYPDMSVNGWLRIFRIARSYGLNHIRFHSWCPPEAAFRAADQMGFYLQVEGPFWTTVGEGKPIDDFIYREIDAILQEYGNHPSFCMLSYGNEPGGKNRDKFLGELVKHWKSRDNRHLYTGASGWPELAENDYYLTPKPRIQHWREELHSRVNREPLQTDNDYSDFIKKFDIPVVSHEIGEWCVYPDFSEIDKYTGVLKARNFEIARESLQKNHMLDQANSFLMASGKLQTLLYKEEIEAALRTPDFGGFQLLDLHDFPGQGTALVGVLNAFWQDKGYVSAAEYSRFCSPVVPLLRAEKFVFFNDETLQAHAVLANYGPEVIRGAVPEWKIAFADGSVYSSGTLPAQDIPQGQPAALGEIKVDLGKIKQATQLKLTLSIRDTEYWNAWPLWVYPRKLNLPAAEGVLYAEEFDKTVIRALKQGRKVFLLPDVQSIDSDVPNGFSTIFWNTEWTNGQKPHTLGILCNPAHPALKYFPTEFHSNWQWWDINYHSRPMILDDMPATLRPIVQVIDDWNSNRRLGLVFEARVGKGRLLVVGVDLKNDLKNRPVARQLRYSLEKYINSADFNPQQQVEPAAIADLLKKTVTITTAQDKPR